MSDPVAVFPVAMQGPPIWRETVEWEPGLVCHKGPWATAVRVDGSLYTCRIDHTAADFAEDLEAGRWFLEVSAQLTPEWQEAVQATVDAANTANQTALGAVASTAIDRAATAEDRSATGQDRVATAADRVAAGNLVIAAQAARDAGAASAALAAAYAAAAPTVAAVNWAALATIVGTVPGQLALSYEGGSATHTDPVVGGAVPNDGAFSWDPSGANAVKWRYVGVRASQGFADIPTTIAGASTVLSVNPLGLKGAVDARVGPFLATDETSYHQGRLVVRTIKDANDRTGWILTEDGYLFAKYAIKLGQAANGLTLSRTPDGFLTVGLGTEAGKMPVGAYGDVLDASIAGSFGGYLRAMADNSGRIALGVRDDGTVVIPKLEAGSVGGGGLVNTVESTNYWFELKTLFGKSQIIRTAKATGVAAQVTSLGTNTAPRLSADGANLIYNTDRFGAPVAMFQPVGGGSERRVLPLRSVCCWGDSLTAGSGISVAGKDYPNQLVRLANRDTFRASGSGQKSTQIASRAGAVPITLTVTGGFIPTSGSVACTSVVPDFLNTSGATNSLVCAIAGVPGVMSWVTPGSYNFTPSIYPASPVAAPPGTLCTPNLQGRDEWIWALWMGRNNWIDPPTVKADIAATIAQIKTMVRRYVVLSVVNAGSEPVGSSGHTNITAINTYLAATYPDNFIDIRRYLIDHGLADAGITPTSQDLTDIANDVIPTSLRSDDVHGNDFYYLIVAQRVAAFLTAKGW